MARKRTVSRRTALKVTGTAAATALVAGCSSGGGGDDGSSDDGSSDDGIEVDPGQIELEAATSAWIGVSPDSISEEENPTLILQEGEEYEIGWNTGDGKEHNIEVRNDSGDPLEQDGEELATEQVTDEEPDDQWLTFEATSDASVYRCNPHASMEGDIVVE
ncbi:hypothetical protein HALLA_18755 [Halostagnicola larsenii XH-48]|uniref:Blue (type 1) copper domain-containing protein n=1 Tax=Halostagnicola larsenii XH-48 TaxID=797299 RepID=W0JP74_9EURY|nr:twin-arginine translocation signal domain-containing protein [Halostagnicola larsenii]AHG00526.1 hypothetical protein HALLA_18755 [Halostagnicola larsenii XH-48]